MQVRRAHGARVNGMIDFTSGWLVANIGHDNRAVMRAVRKARGWAVMVGAGLENPLRDAAEEAMLAILPPHLDRVAFYNSGSEAIDAAIRLAGGDVIALPDAFHGSTIGAQSIKRVEAHDIQDMDHLPSGVLVETFLGPWCEWHDDATIAHLREYQLPGNALIFDEMQAGFGRTGKWWGFEHYDIKPDLLVGGKGVAGGFPMAFVASRSELTDGKPQWESTFSGNSLSCAACVATIWEITRKKLIERVRRLEPMIQEAFPQAQGRGFAYAFPHPRADDVVDRALVRGLLLLRTGRGTVKICPPLRISKRDLVRGLSILQESL